MPLPPPAPPSPADLESAGRRYHATRRAYKAGDASRNDAQAAEREYLRLLKLRPDPQALHPVEIDGRILGARPEADGNGLRLERIEAVIPVVASLPKAEARV